MDDRNFSAGAIHARLFSPCGRALPGEFFASLVDELAAIAARLPPAPSHRSTPPLGGRIPPPIQVADLDTTPTHVWTEHVLTLEITSVVLLPSGIVHVKFPDGRGGPVDVMRWLARSDRPQEGDRLIVHQDGHLGWCPRAEFERNYRAIGAEDAVPEAPALRLAGLTFGDALAALKRGALVARAGWNGKGMWLAMTPGSTIPAAAARSGACKALVEFEAVPEVAILPHIDMRGADGRVTIGWAPSQPDMFAEDWQLVAFDGKSVAPPSRTERDPVSSDEALFEQQLQASGKMAPRLTPELIDAQIVDEWYVIVPNSVLTICALTLRNGFVVVGYDGPVSRENFDATIGRQSARSNAREQIWRLEGYWLKSALAGLASQLPLTPV